MFVRTAGERDLPAIRSLLVETWHDTYDAIYGRERVTAITDEWHSLDALKARLVRPDSEFLVADDGRLIGGMAFATAEEDGRTVALHQLYVQPALQGHGIGGMLLDEIEGAFPGAETLRLRVETANAKAVGFYVGLGFTEAASASEDGGGLSAIRIATYERPIVWA